MGNTYSQIPQHTHQKTPRKPIAGPAVIAKAPYNFVPLPQQVVPAQGEPPDHDHYTDNTGWIDCQLETLTPVYVRGMMTSQTFAEYGDTSTAFDDLPSSVKQEKARFFAIEDRVMIPGSSLRGMFRSLVEIAGFGKLSQVTDKQMIFRAVGDPSSLGQYYRGQVLGSNKAHSPDNHFDYPSPLLRGGYLRHHNGQWFIQPAQVHTGESFVHVEYEDASLLGVKKDERIIRHVFVEPASRRVSNRGMRGRGQLTLDVAVAPHGRLALMKNNPSPPSSMVPAVLVVSGHMGGGHAKHWHCAIYAPDASAKLIPIPDSMWKLYAEDRDANRGIPTRQLTADGDPLFYLSDKRNELVFFGPTMMFRLPYGKRIVDFVPPWLRDEKTLDLAEAMFGYVKSDQLPYGKERAYAGRVFVGDASAMPDQGKLMDDAIINPKILGGPKPSTFQHYLTQPDRAASDKLELKHYASNTPDETVVRGHKLYWHRKVTQSGIANDNSKANKTQLTGIKPVRADAKFNFRVRFENLSDVELGALLWVLDLPAGCAHKLGMGKPLGLGSVRISVQSLHLTERQARYSKLLDGDQWASGDMNGNDKTDLKQTFEKYVLEQMDAADRNNAQSLADTPRIHELLCMLSYESAPLVDETRYLEIERLNVNEYKERPVLPRPSQVIGKPAPKTSTTPSSATTMSGAQTAIKAATGTPPKWRTGTITEIRPDRWRGRVRDMETNQVYSFDTHVIVGDTPANRATVLFDLQGDQVVALKRR